LSSLHGDDFALDGVPNQFGVGFDLQKLHGVIFVRQQTVGESPIRFEIALPVRVFSEQS